MERKTGCECPLAGLCNRHGVEKSAHQHKLCQMHEGYFNMWEQCRGPGQNPSTCVKPTEPPKEVEPVAEKPKPQNKQQLPSKTKMAGNFLKAAAQHLGNGMRQASAELQEERLDICRGCEYLIEESFRCSECGCHLAAKAKWQSSSCPKGKW